MWRVPPHYQREQRTHFALFWPAWSIPRTNQQQKKNRSRKKSLPVFRSSIPNIRATAHIAIRTVHFSWIDQAVPAAAVVDHAFVLSFGGNWRTLSQATKKRAPDNTPREKNWNPKVEPAGLVRPRLYFHIWLTAGWLTQARYMYLSGYSSPVLWRGSRIVSAVRGQAPCNRFSLVAIKVYWPSSRCRSCAIAIRGYWLSSSSNSSSVFYQQQNGMIINAYTNAQS